MVVRIVIALAALFAASPLRAETTTLRFGQIPSTARGVSSLSHFIAERQGFFARENIALEIVQIPGGIGNMVSALDRGEVVAIDGYRFRAGHAVDGRSGWKAESDLIRKAAPKAAQKKKALISSRRSGVLIALTGIA